MFQGRLHALANARDRVVSGTHAGVGGHPNASDSQVPDPGNAKDMLSIVTDSRGGRHSLLICVPLSRKIPSE